jgi:hypothetical protein
MMRTAEEQAAWTAFANRAFLYCRRMAPGSRVEIARIPNLESPDRFVEAVKESMDWGLLKDFSFSSDYAFLQRDAEWKSQRLTQKPKKNGIVHGHSGH